MGWVGLQMYLLAYFYFCLQITVSGYAAAGGGRGVERVDISVDGGKTWIEASRFQKPGVPYVADDLNNDKWAWVLFQAEVDVPHSTEIVAKAVCLFLVMASLHVHILCLHPCTESTD